MSEFAHTLIAWQRTHGRHDLPWQRTRDPYRVWLSEIMLQQTQVSTVIPYYERFLARFPDLPALAQASVEEVMPLWAGLGYYARARNLHRAAQQVMSQHGGTFPRTQEQIMTLPGVGRSTAAAIAAFCFGQRAAILDGNVKRVLTRAFGIAGFPGEKAVERQLWDLAEQLLPQQDVDTYTQALMDLGATACTRAQAACDRCPVAIQCVARSTGRVTQLPTPRARKAVPTRQGHYLVVRQAGRIFLQQRPATGIWGGLLSLPEWDGTSPLADWLHAAFQLRITHHTPLPAVQHRFTHFELILQPVLCEVDATTNATPTGCRWVAQPDLHEAALPAPVRRLLLSLPG